MEPQFEIAKEFRFEAAHSLPHLPPTHKCHRLHGHSYKIVVICRGQLDPAFGWVIDYAAISSVVKPFVDEVLDHRNLDEVLARHRHNGPSTAENLAAFLYPQFKQYIDCVYQIEVHETATTVVRYPVYPNTHIDGRISPPKGAS